MVKIGDIELGKFPLLLAPMEDVSDPPFRALCKENGADVVYTEFISSEGLIRDAAKSVMKLDIYEKERPVGIQIFGANLDSMLRSVDIVEKTNPDIIDINFGCPVKKVVCKGAGAGFLKVPSSLGSHKQKSKKNLMNYLGGNLQLIHGSRMFLSPSTITIEPKVGEMYFFPHYMMHCVYPFKNSNEERRSISFNASIDEEIFNVYGRS